MRERIPGGKYAEEEGQLGAFRSEERRVGKEC